MKFKNYSELEGSHAFLSPSQPAWLRYDDDKLRERYINAQAVERGTKLHALAHDLIVMNVMLPRSKTSLNMFVNDAIGFKMTSEQPLFYNGLCYGTADAIEYRRNCLRIHDLKTGETEGKMEQLEVYAALFCLNYQILTRIYRKDGMSDVEIAKEFDVKPSELHFDPRQMSGIELRIYQYGEIKSEEPDPELILDHMENIVHKVDVLKEVKAEG